MLEGWFGMMLCDDFAPGCAIADRIWFCSPTDKNTNHDNDNNVKRILENKHPVNWDSLAKTN